jgi:peptide/nickel transport system permease protein
MSEQKGFSFRQYAWEQFKKNRPAKWSLNILIAIGFIAFFAPFIANHQPLYVKVQGESYFPAFSNVFNENHADSLIDPATGKKEWQQFSSIDWRSYPNDFAIFPPIAYSPDFTDNYNRDYVGPWHEQRFKNEEGEMINMPLKWKHWMGTDRIGRDVAAGIIHGTRISMLIGVFSMFIAGLIGITLGALAGYFGNTELKVNRLQFIFLILFGGYTLFIVTIAKTHLIANAFEEGETLSAFLYILLFIGAFVLSIRLAIWLGKKLGKTEWLKKEKTIAVDSMVSRTIEILNSLPTLILIISVAAVMNERSLVALMTIIGLTSWTGIARFMRAEVLRLKNLEFIQSARALGYNNKRIIIKHILPNGLGPITVSLAFGVASAILVESGLSFLGIGVPDDITTWGSLLSQGREEFEASWLVLFPGLAIFITITVYNLIGEGLRDALDPKLKAQNAEDLK